MSAAATDKPFHLQGNFAPVQLECTATEAQLEVEGALPPELNGLYVRNGPNPQSGASQHWFFGDGMLHGVRLQGGRALWYRNRYVQSARFKAPQKQRVSPTGEIDRTLSTANTHIVAHAGKLLALEEASFPYAVDAELNTIGMHNYGGQLQGAFTAHPHVCPQSGELLAFGYNHAPPYLKYHRISAEGALLQSRAIEVPGPTMMHDFMATQNYVLFMDLPVVFNVQAALAGTMPYQWSDEYGARVGVMPRNNAAAKVRWFEVQPCYVFHAMNAYEKGETIVCDVCRISEMWRAAGDIAGGGGASGEGERTLHRWEFNLKSGAVREQTLDERGVEFPRVADARAGLQNRYGYALQIDALAAGGFGGHIKFDLQSGQSAVHRYPGGAAGEPVFVPAPGAAADSDEGWVLSFVYDEAGGKSALVVLDAQNFCAPPIARVKLPQRVPFGFHGNWVGQGAV